MLAFKHVLVVSVSYDIIAIVEENMCDFVKYLCTVCTR